MLSIALMTIARLFLNGIVLMTEFLFFKDLFGVLQSLEFNSKIPFIIVTFFHYSYVHSHIFLNYFTIMSQKRTKLYSNYLSLIIEQ